MQRLSTRGRCGPSRSASTTRRTTRRRTRATSRATSAPITPSSTSPGARRSTSSRALPVDVRRAVRRLVADPDVPGLAHRPCARDGEPLGRRRRRALRRLRPLRAQRPARAAARVAAARRRARCCTPPRPPVRARSPRPREGAAAPRCASPGPPRSSPSSRRCSAPPTRAHSTRACHAVARRARAGDRRRGRFRRTTAWLSRIDGPAVDYASRMMLVDHPHLPPRRHPGEGRPRRDGSSARDARAAARPRPCRVGVALPLGLKLRGGTRQAPAARAALRVTCRATLIDRPKRGFRRAARAWLRGPLRDWAEHSARAEPPVRGGLPRSGEGARTVGGALVGTRDAQDALWTVLTFQAWLADAH